MIPTADPSRIPSFSTPDVDPEGRRALVREILSSDAREFTQGLLRRFGSEIGARSEGLVELLETLIKRELTLEEALGFPVPLHRAGWGGEGFDPVWPALAAALHVQGLGGAPGDFSARLAQPRPLRCGQRVSPAAAQVSVIAGGAGISADGLAVDLWRTLPAIATPATGAEHDRLGAIVLGREAIGIMPIDNAIGWADESDASVVENLREAFEVLRLYAPEYQTWVSDVLRYVVPLQPPAPDVRRSHSVKGLPGVVFMSFPASPVKTAETLIHECAHQLYHLIESWFAISNLRDERMYYSVYVRKERSIDRVLIAFHAFANVVRFHRLCAERGAPFGDECMKIVDENVPHLAEFRTHLQQTQGLTAAGRAMWEPAMEALS